MNIGENIKNFRTFRGFSQQDLADQLNRTKSVISNWERGANYPDVETCEKLCKILKVTPNELFGWDKNVEYEKHQKILSEYYARVYMLEQKKAEIELELQDLNTRLLFGNTNED